MSDELIDRGDDIIENEEIVEELAPKEEVEAKEEQHMIPKSRFDEAVRKERAEKEELARRVQAFEAKEVNQRTAADFDAANVKVKELIKQHTSLIADGELEKASSVMEQMLELKDAISEAKASARANATKSQAKEEVQYDAAVARLEAAYPEIDPDNDAYDKAAVRKVQAYMTGLMQNERMSASKALKEAVETILGEKAKAEDAGMRRKQEAVSRNMAAKARQPASTRSVGLDHDKEGGPLDSSAVMKMSWDEFVKLPDSKLAEMRGDLV